MASQTPIGGKFNLRVNGVLYRAKGSFTWNLGLDKVEGILGADGPHGFKSQPQFPSLQGAISITPDVDVPAVLTARDATVTLELVNGQVIVFEQAWQTGAGNATTEEGELEIEFQAMKAEMV